MELAGSFAFSRSELAVSSFSTVERGAERTAAIWAEELQLPVEVTRLAFKTLKPSYFETGAPKTENLKGSLEEVMESGAIKEPLDFSKIVDSRFLPR